MWRYLLGSVVLGMAVAHFAQKLPTKTEELAASKQGVQTQAQLQGQSQAPQQVARVKPAAGSNNFAGRTARIAMDNRGHFETTARMNGRKVEVLVDTGATSVAINETTARRLGINLRQQDFKYSVSTANGKTKAASAVIDRIEIGRVVVRDVRAAVLSDKALDGTLLGMTFLGQLKSFEVKNRELLLTQ